MFEKLVMMSDESSGVSEWTADYGSMKKKDWVLRLWFSTGVICLASLPCLGECLEALGRGFLLAFTG